MILRGHQRDGGIAVRDGEEGDLRALEPLLDDQRPAGVAHLALEHQLADGAAGLFARAGNNHALAAGEAVGLERDLPAKLVYGFVSLLRRFGDAVASRRHAGQRHQVLGKRLARFEARRVSGGAEEHETFGGERVGQATFEGRFGSDHRERDVLAARELHEAVDVGGGHGKAPDIAGDSGVPRGAEDLGHAGFPTEFPDERVLPGAGSDHQDFHGRAILVPESDVRRPRSTLDELVSHGIECSFACGKEDPAGLSAGKGGAVAWLK